MENWEKAFNEIVKDGWNAETFPAIKRFIRRILKQKWEHEFKDRLNCVLKVSELIKTYVGWHSKVKIKCKNGCIQIERINDKS